MRPCLMLTVLLAGCGGAGGQSPTTDTHLAKYQKVVEAVIRGNAFEPSSVKVTKWGPHVSGKELLDRGISTPPEPKVLERPQQIFIASAFAVVRCEFTRDGKAEKETHLIVMGLPVKTSDDEAAWRKTIAASWKAQEQGGFR